MSIIQSNLPYDFEALEPHVSAKTLTIHYGKHHRAYVDKLNQLIDGTALEDLTLEEIITKARNKVETKILNNASQAWNHTFLWQSMSPNSGRKPEGHIKEMIESQYGDIDEFKHRFRDAALSQFGSGWVWLVVDRDNLRILTTGNADSPVGTRMKPLLTLDL